MDWTSCSDKLIDAADGLRLKLGFRPRCKWVCERMGAYYQWDLSQAEFREVARHLHACPDCAKVWRETQQLLEQLEAASPIAEQLSNCSSALFVTNAIARIDEYEAGQANNTQERRHGIQAWVNAHRISIKMQRLATALLFLMSIAALATWGPQVLRRTIDSRRPGEKNGSCISAQTLNRQLESSADPKGVPSADSTANQLKIPGTSEIPNLSPRRQLDPGPELARQIDSLTAHARARLRMPQSEAQWEAWARREYPHVMWIHNLLTHPEYGFNWDGQADYVPEWARQIWTDAGPRPSGWRALVCYSGEILRFDYPALAEASNVRPRIEAIKLAAAIAGYEMRLNGEGQWPLPAWRDSDADLRAASTGAVLVSLIRLKDVPDWAGLIAHRNVRSLAADSISQYLGRISGDRDQLVRVLVYFSASARLIPGEPWRELAARAEDSLAAIEQSGPAVCELDAWQAGFQALMVQHAHLAAKLLGKEEGYIIDKIQN